LNLSEIRDLSLALINSLSAEGTRLEESDIADLKFAFPGFLNTAQTKFAEKDKIEDVLPIVQVSSDVGDILHPLPTSLISINKVIFLNSNGRRRPFSDYSEEMGNIVIDSSYEGSFFIYYNKRPTPLVLDTDLPSIQPQFHQYLAYFCAGTWLFSTGKEQNGIIYLNMFDGFLHECEPNNETGSGLINQSSW